MGAPAETREAYMLKNLSSRWAWVGTVVHQRIETILKRIQERARGGHLEFESEAIDTAKELDALTEGMRQQYRQSKQARYRESPKRNFGLMEHEYGDPVSDEEWRATNEKARQAYACFLDSDLFQAIRETDPSTWYPIESLDQFDFDGVGVWAVPDFARRTEDGGAEIYDWKTGKVQPEGNRLQLACYTLYMQAKHGRDPQRTTNHIVYLGPELVVHDFVLDPEALDDAREQMQASMDAMRERLADVATNRAEREDFPLTDDREKCHACVYRRLCGR